MENGRSQQAQVSVGQSTISAARDWSFNGAKRWRRTGSEAATILRAAFQADYVVFGGGNAKRLKEPPEHCRRGGNHNVCFGGLRMWEDATERNAPTLGVFALPETAAQ